MWIQRERDQGSNIMHVLIRSLWRLAHAGERRIICGYKGGNDDTTGSYLDINPLGIVVLSGNGPE